MMAVWRSPNVKDRLNEERNEVKVSRSVLESSGSRKGVADFNRSPINACPLVCHLPELRDNPEYYSQKKTLPQLKKTHPWYAEIYSQVLQDVVKRVKVSFDRFLKGDSNGKRSVRFVG